MGNDLFTIFVLLYGDWTPLAMRCIDSIIDGATEVCPENIRVGVNQGSAETYDYLSLLVNDGRLYDCNIYWSQENIHKYPMMRQMFYDPDNPIETDYVMWFDDDSFIKPRNDAAFLRDIESSINNRGVGGMPQMLGGVYTIRLMPQQEEWIKAQPWYTGSRISNPMRFATGGWWVLDTQIMRSLDYPWKCLDHRGGDVMLGAAIEQQGIVLRNFRHGVAINADLQGRESKADRRGFDQPPLGVNGPVTPDMPPCQPAVMLSDLSGMPTHLSRLAARHARQQADAVEAVDDFTAKATEGRTKRLRNVLDL